MTNYRGRKLGKIRSVEENDQGLSVTADLDPVGEEIMELMSLDRPLTDAESMRLSLLMHPPKPGRLPRWLRRIIRRRAAR